MEGTPDKTGRKRTDWVDWEELDLYLAVVMDGEPRELRVVMGSGEAPATAAGLFRDAPTLRAELKRLVDAGLRWETGCYLLPDPTTLDAPRMAGRIRTCGRGQTTCGRHVARRTTLKLDIDPKRAVKGASSTDGEKEAARKMVLGILKWLKAKGFPDPWWTADSGNGWHVVWRCELPGESRLNDRFTEMVWREWDGDRAEAPAEVDLAVGSRGRAWKLYGTLSVKGEDTPDRPWRTSRLKWVNAEPTTVTAAHLDALLGPEPAVVRPTPPPGGWKGDGWSVERFDDYVTTMLDRFGPRPVPNPDWHSYELAACPFNTHPNRFCAVVGWRDGALSFFCHHDSCRGYGWQSLRNAHPPVRWETDVDDDELGTKTSSAATPVVIGGAPRFTTTLAEDIPVKPIEFLWNGWLARGSISMICGLPGAGKSYSIEDIISAMSTGRKLPGEIDNREPVDVLMVLSENSWTKIVKPRLLACGANCKRIRRLDEINEDGRAWDLSMVNQLEEASRGCAVILVDPVTSYLPPKMEPNSVSEVRALLRPLNDLVERTDQLLLLNHHLNKKVEVGAGQRIMGSGGWEAGVLTTVFVCRDKEDKDVRLFLPGEKWNGWEQPKGLKFTLRKQSALDAFPGVVWLGETDMTADDGLNQRVDRVCNEITGWLESELSPGSEKSAKQMAEAAREMGFSPATLNRIKRKMKIVSIQRNDGWTWVRPAKKGSDDQNV